MKIKKYLILGGSGFIGRHVAKKLSEQNKVVVADLICNEEFIDNENITFMKLDFIKTKDFRPYLKDIDTVIHLISTVLPAEGTNNINKEIEENIFPTINLLDSMVSMGILDIIFMSSGGTVYGEVDDKIINENTNKNPICKYAVHKLTIEYYLNLYNIYHNLNYKIMRAANPYSCEVKQNKMQGLIPILIKKIISGEDIIIWGDGENIRDYIYIDDLVDAFMAIEKYDGREKVFNVGSGFGCSINEILSILIEKLNVLNLNIIHENTRKCDVQSNILNISLIKECTGWKPKINIVKGIELSIRSLK